eukprot:CAMPEP_0182438786 /NCGR_PEP_ID=MMETSP1167-20130531/86002_1 /TAXON_ID=2988 /ORGANISM="Mallomonas Sp, Strain CCMP3275" /LENGTH=751 /DNA_ID=CAMNT_0024632303 /DNA_START=33 /DNA_END=2289 /DNA_ORIENTATION=+
MGDDYEDVDWEDADDLDSSFQEYNAAGDLKNDSPGGNCIRGKRKRHPEFAQILAESIDYHKSQLCDASKRARKISNWCSDDIVRETILSLFPFSTYHFLKSNTNNLQSIQSIMDWFQSNFTAIDSKDVTVDEGRDGSNPDDLCVVIATRTGSCHQLTQLFVALLRALKWPCRYVCSLHPTPPRPTEYMRHKKRRLGGLPGIHQGRSGPDAFLADTIGANEEEEVPCCWTEVFLPTVSDGVASGPDSGKKRRKRYVCESEEENRVGGDGEGVIDLSGPDSSTLSAPPLSLSLSLSLFNLNNPDFFLVTSLIFLLSLSLSLSLSPAHSVFDLNDLDDDQEEAEGEERTRVIQQVNSSSEKSPAVSCSSTRGRWVHVDAVRNMLNQPDRVEHRLLEGRKRVFAYVIAVDQEGFVTDVSSRYCNQPVLSANMRLRKSKIGWWSERLQEMNHRARVKIQNKVVLTDTGDWTIGVSREQQCEHSQRLQQDAEELQQCAVSASSPLPTSLAGFKNHPVYVLKRHLNSTQSLYPGNQRPVAVFKGEPVYQRAQVSELLSISQWRRRAREVKEADRDSPVKTVAMRRKPENSDGMSANWRDWEATYTEGSGDSKQMSADKVSLYGEWQTIEIQPGSALDGIIPTNQYGDVEVWGHNPALLPVGTALVQGTLAVQAAKQLNLPHAAAIVDFETRNGRRVPKLDGAVVLTDHAELVQEAAANLEEERCKKADYKREKIMLSRWEKIARGVLSRNRLRETYGH